MTSTNLDFQIALHYGIPNTASILAFDPIQRLLAIGTLDGRIKIIGGDNIEGLLISPKKLPFKNLEFLCNQGFLVGVSNENDIQVWDIEHRRLTDCLPWQSNITAFSVMHGTYFVYVGDEYGLMSVLKYDAEEGKILRLPYHIPAKPVTEAAGISMPIYLSVVGILPQPCTCGNRVLIAYGNGLIVLWDVSENRAVNIGGCTLQLNSDGVAHSSTGLGNEHQGNLSEFENEKEICSLCWASKTGSILAVGYMDGDILLWNISSDVKAQHVRISSDKVVKLQLSSGGRRLPVIVLHWSPNNNSKNDYQGQLFIYGGDEVGSEEVLTVLSLDWPSGIEILQCVARVDLKLRGSFADMILIPNAGVKETNPTAALFVLTNPGQLHVYDGLTLATMRSQENEIPSFLEEKFPVAIPTVDPYITVTKLCSLPMENCFKALFERTSSRRSGVTHMLSAGTKWPLTGGVPSELSFAEDIAVERIYIAGYQDGSTRIWNATYPTLTVMFVLEEKMHDIQVSSPHSSVSALEFCYISMSLAIGSENGLVRVYKFHGSQDSSSESSSHIINETKHEVHVMQHEEGSYCTAVFSVLKSPVQTLQFANSGAKLAVGFRCGEVLMLDMSSFSVLFHVNCLSPSPVISMAMKIIPDIDVLIKGPKHSSPISPKDPTNGIFILTKDAHVVIIDSLTGSIISSRPLHPKKESTAISMYLIDGSVTSEMASQKLPEYLSQGSSFQTESEQSNYSSGSSKSQEVEQHLSIDTSCPGELIPDSLFLLCCEDALRLYSSKSVIQGGSNFIRKVNLLKPACWSTIFRRKDERTCGLILLYQTGVLETRSLPDLEVLGESSLMSTLRWCFKANMEKTMSSCDNGQITLVNGCELAILSPLACSNDFRIPESLPCLHDKVLAAAAEAAISLSTSQRKKQGTTPGILGGIIKGFKGSKGEKDVDVSASIPRSNFIQQLEGYFSKGPFSEPSTEISYDQESGELSIDDIEIDEVLPIASTSSRTGKHDGREEEMEREKLFHGTTVDTKPRLRTTEEILTQYKFAGDASAAAAHARDKLVQRQEKLQRISKRTEELQSGAENFASMADELVKTMENRKWWKI